MGKGNFNLLEGRKVTIYDASSLSLGFWAEGVFGLLNIPGTFKFQIKIEDEANPDQDRITFSGGPRFEGHKPRYKICIEMSEVEFFKSVIEPQKSSSGPASLRAAEQQHQGSKPQRSKPHTANYMRERALEQLRQGLHPEPVETVHLPEQMGSEEKEEEKSPEKKSLEEEK